MKASANIFPYLQFLLEAVDQATPDASNVKTYFKDDGSFYARFPNGDIVLIGPGAAGAVGNFTDLTDVPNSYIGDGLKLVRVANSEDGLEFFDFDINNYVPDQSGHEQQFLKTDGTNVSWGASTVYSYSFRDLTDTPNTFVGHSLGLVRCNGAESALQYVDGSNAIEQQARVGVRKNSTGTTSIRRRINFIEGSNVTITVADDSGDEEIDVTINATATTPASPTMSRVNSSAYEASRVIKSSSGNLRIVYGYNSKASAQFIQLFDSTALPADGVAPTSVIAVDAQKSFSIALSDNGIPFTSGIVVCNSSTGPTKTIGSADCYFTAVFD